MPKQNKASLQPADAPARALSPQEGDAVVLEGLKYRVESKIHLDGVEAVFVRKNQQPRGAYFLNIRKMVFDRNAKVWRAELSDIIG